MYQRKVKKPNWLEILDSSHCFRKFICKRHRPARSMGSTVTCSQPSLLTTETNKSAPTRKLKLNECWNLASDTANYTASMQAETVAKARRQEKQKPKSKDNQKSKMEHKPKETLDHKPEVTLVHNLQDDLVPETEYEQQTISQDAQESSEDDKKAKKKVPTRRSAKVRKQSPRRPMDFPNIIFLDARTMPWDRPKPTSQDATTKHKFKAVHHGTSRLKHTGRSKRIYGVPLCGPPSLTMDVVYPLSKQIKLRQQKLYQRSEYQDQYSLMLQSQLHQPEHSCQQQCIDGGMPISLQFLAGTEPYTVPSKDQFQRVQKGQKYCGNFYYK